MLSLRQILTNMGKNTPISIQADLMLCNSLHDSLVALNHQNYKLLIITPQEFVEELWVLKNHKDQHDMHTLIVTLEHVYQTYPGRDEAEKIKRCIALFQLNNNARYAMLVGDCDRFPVRYEKWADFEADHSPNARFHTLYIAVDLYYSDLYKKDGSFDDWDKNKDGYFGEILEGDAYKPINIDDIDFIPDIAVGRILASTIDDVKRYVKKVIQYENGAYGSDWASRALLIATKDWRESACEELDTIAKIYLKKYNIIKLYSTGNPCEITESQNSKIINDYIEDGVGFVTYIGHGGLQKWQTDNDYDVSDILALSNSSKLPIVFASACDTAGFYSPIFPLSPYRDVNGVMHRGTEKTDNNPNPEYFNSTPPQPACIQDDFTLNSMAETMTVNIGGGAIAYIGASLTSNDESLDLLHFFFESIQKKQIIGDVWINTIKSYYNKYNHPDLLPQLSQPLRYLLLGDPSLRIGGISPH